MAWEWTSLDAWIAATAALAAMSCALPGTFLVLRRQSLFGDALSHATLPGIVLAFLALHQLEAAGWLSPGAAAAVRHITLFAGATAMGVLCGVLSTLVERYGRVEASAALGVVFTSLFAFGLLLVRLTVDQVHLDAGCVLYGNLEASVADTLWGTPIPRAAVVNGGMLLVNAVLLGLFYKELKLCAFDPDQAQALGFPAERMRLALIAVTGATVVAAFESVGSVLVIAMLVAPPATALLLSDRLGGVLACALGAAALSAVCGHAGALWLPPLLGAAFGLDRPGDVSTAGMMTVVAGGLFILAAVASPRYGLLRRWLDQRRLAHRIVAEDVLGILYRLEDLLPGTSAGLDRRQLAAALNVSLYRIGRCAGRLARQGLLRAHAVQIRLTESGRAQARQLVRSHRLWETYLARMLGLPPERLHASAERVEHYLDAQLRAELAAELAQPDHDPHGAAIPPEHAG